MKFGFVIVFCSIYLSSCKKEEKLPPDYFIGTWDWEYTLAYYVNDHGQIYKTDTIRPYSAKWGIDFDCHFELKQSGDIYFYRDENFYYKIKSKKLTYYEDINPDIKNCHSNGDIYDDSGEFERLILRGNINDSYLGCHGFPLEAVDYNEISILTLSARNESNYWVHNIFSKR